MRKSIRLIAVVFLLLNIVCTSAIADTVKVVRTIDGDTVVVQHPDLGETTLRFACVDSSEIARSNLDKVTTDLVKKDQYLWGDVSRAMVNFLIGDSIDIKITDIDRYGRAVADISLTDGKNLQEELLSRGLTQIYPKYFKLCPNGEAKATAQKYAHLNKWGLWSDVNYISPWLFRARMKN